MALSARELLLIVRAQNQASGALRRVARDVRGLPDMQSLRQRRDQQAINLRQARASRQITLNELRSIETGRRRHASERRILGAQLAQARQAAQMMRFDRQRFDASTRQLNQERIMQNIGFQTARAEALRARAMGKSAEEQRKYFEAARKDPMSRAAVIENRIRNLKQAAVLNERITTSTGMTQDAFIREARILSQNAEQLRLRYREAVSAQADLAARAGVLNNRLGIQSDRIALADEKFRDYQHAIRSARWDRVSVGGQVLQHFGRVAQYAALIAGGAFAYAANSAAEFSTRVTFAATQTGRTGADIARNAERIRRGVLSMMSGGQTTATVDELNRAFYEVFSSLNVSVPGGVRLMRLFGRASIAGLTPITEVAESAITVMNNFNIPVSRMQQTFQRMFAAVRFGRMTFQQFTGTMSTLAPAARIAGISFDDMAASLAFVTRRIPQTRMAATGLARLIEILGRPDFQEGLRHFGVRITDAQNRLLPMPRIVQILTDRFKILGNAARTGVGDVRVQNFFKTLTAATGGRGLQGTIQARRAFAVLITGARQFLPLHERVINDNNEFTRSFRALADTSAVKWRLFINQLHAFAIEIGEQAIPAITELGRPLLRAVEWFNNLDEATKRQIGRWGVYSTAILGAGAAVSFVLGIILRLYAVFGRRLGMLKATGVAFVAIATAVGILADDWRSLNDVIGGFVEMGTSSVTGWIVTLGLITAGVLKLRGALISLAIAREAAVGTAAVGGIAGIMRGFRGFGTGVGLTRSAIRTEGAISGILAGLSLIPGGFAATAAAIGVASTAMILLKQHFDDVNRAQQRIQRDQQRIRDLVQRPLDLADAFGGLAERTGNIERAKINFRTIQREIRATQRLLRGARGDRRLELLDQLTLQQLDLADAFTAIRRSIKSANDSFRDFTGSLAAVGRNAKAVDDLKQRLRDLQALRRAGGLRSFFVGPLDIEDLPERLQRAVQRQNINAGNFERIPEFIDATRNSIEQLSAGLDRVEPRLRGRFTGIIRQFQRMRMLPRQIPRKFIDDMFSLALRRGRMLTLPEIRAFIKAEVDPNSLRQANADVRAAIQGGRRARRIRVQVIAPAVQFMRDIFGRGGEGQRRSAANRVALIFANTVRQAQLGRVNMQAVRVGAQIIQGMVSGIERNKDQVSDKVLKVADQAVASARRRLGIKSPSTVFELIGKEVIAGLAKGVAGGTPLIRRLSQNLAINLIPDLEDKVQLTGQRAQRQLAGQLNQMRRFNVDLAVLQRARVPKGLLEQIAEGGLDNLKLLNALVSMTPNQLNTYVQTWRKAMAQIGKVTTDTSQDVEQAVSNMTQVFNEMKQANEEAFGDITQGVRTQNVLEFGGIPRASDLIPDLQDQLRNFNRWRRELNQARRRLPAGLVQQLQEAGPSAEPILRGILRMTPRQIRQYIALWRRSRRAIQNATTVDFNVRLRNWRRHGRNAAILFMKGMADEQGYINQQMRRIFLAFLRGQTKNLAPPRTGGRTGHTTHNDNRIVIHNPKEDTRTTVRKASFKQRQKAKGRR